MPALRCSSTGRRSSRSCSPTRSTTSARSMCGCCSKLAPSARRAAGRSRSAAAAAPSTCGSTSTTARSLSIAAGEGWRHPTRLRTAYQHAVLRGADDSAALLASLGARYTRRRRRPRDRRDRARRAPRHGSGRARLRPAGGRDPRGPARRHAAGHRAARPRFPRRRRRLSGRLVAAARRLGREPRPRRASCWRRAPAVTGGLDWAAHGSQHHAIAGRDYAGVAARLVDAGAVIEPAHLEQADGPLADWLQARRPR